MPIPPSPESIAEARATVFLPRQFNADTVCAVIDQVLALHSQPDCHTVYLDFRNLQFTQPTGMVVLSNLIEYLALRGTTVQFRYHRLRTPAIEYLDDAGFFRQYSTGPVFPDSALRSTTMPLKRIDGPASTEYLYFQLIPWIARIVDQSPPSIDPLRTSLEEIFHNVRDHSGVDAGCTFAQHFPSEKEIHIAVADFGEGIPTVVRRVRPELDDAQAIRLACEEGFTTGTNGHNRGAGIPNLIRYVTQRVQGVVLLTAGQATLSATPTRTTARSERGFFPGTMVRVVIPTTSLRKVAEDTELEDFEW